MREIKSNDKRQFKIGDRVRETGNGAGEGTIDFMEAPGYTGELCYHVVFDGGKLSLWLGDSDLELVEEPNDKRTFDGGATGENTKFKIGDRVRKTRNGTGEGVITCVAPCSYTDDRPYLISLDSGRQLWLGDYDIELVEDKSVQDNSGKYGHPKFYEMLEAMADLHSRKNHDYAGTSDPLKNLRACERLDLTPFMGVMVRLQDKWSRLEEFVKSGKLMVKGEGVKDTLMDNAVYSILAIILYEEQESDA